MALKSLSKRVIVFFVLYFSIFSMALTVVSEKGAMVYYNDSLVGSIKDTALSFSATFPGLLKVVKPGYLPFEKEITEDGTIVAQLTFPSYLKINVSPEDAEVYINDVKISTDKMQIIKPGKYNIKISAPGFTTKSIEVTIKEKEEKTLDVSLKRTVTLTIQSNKSISGIMFDGKFINVPNVLEVLPGKYQLILPNNFVEKIQEFNIPPVDSFSITINTRQVHKLQISGEPENAYAMLNEEIHKLPFDGSLIEGFYKLVIYAEGYKEETRELDLKNDTVINYVLEPDNLYKFEFSEKNYRVEFDGFPLDKLVRKIYFGTIKDQDDNIIWFGFTDGNLKTIPSTIPILVSSDYQVTIGNQTYIGPAILQVQKGQKINLYNRLSGTETTIAEKLTIFDSPEKCLVNIYSKTTADVFFDGRFIGKTPIYLFTTNEGKHEILLKKNEQEIFKAEAHIRKGTLNEIRIDK